MDIYGLIGFPLNHSFSATFFNQRFQAENVDAKYLNFDIPDISHLMELIAEYPELKGFNVTRPYKEQVIPYIDVMDAQAKGVGAVNAVKLVGNAYNGEFKLHGFNTDVYGFTESIKPLLDAKYTSALILGTGGAAKAVKYALNQMGIKTKYVSRSPERGDYVYSQLTPEIIHDNLLIVNATPLGQIPDVEAVPDIPYEALTPEHLCYDLIYNPEFTRFLKESQEYGARVKNGLEMLLLQAQESWNIWNS